MAFKDDNRRERRSDHSSAVQQQLSRCFIVGPSEIVQTGRCVKGAVRPRRQVCKSPKTGRTASRQKADRASSPTNWRRGDVLGRRKRSRPTCPLPRLSCETAPSRGPVNCCYSRGRARESGCRAVRPQFTGCLRARQGQSALTSPPAPRGCAPNCGRPCGSSSGCISRSASGSCRRRGRIRRAGCPFQVHP